MRELNSAQVREEIEAAETRLLSQSPTALELWRKIRISPELWSQETYPRVGDVWVVGLMGRSCLCWNPAEEGWGWASFSTNGKVEALHLDRSKLASAVLRIEPRRWDKFALASPQVHEGDSAGALLAKTGSQERAEVLREDLKLGFGAALGSIIFYAVLLPIFDESWTTQEGLWKGFGVGALLIAFYAALSFAKVSRRLKAARE